MLNICNLVTSHTVFTKIISFHRNYQKLIGNLKKGSLMKMATVRMQTVYICWYISWLKDKVYV